MQTVSALAVAPCHQLSTHTNHYYCQNWHQCTAVFILLPVLILKGSFTYGIYFLHSYLIPIIQSISTPPPFYPFLFPVLAIVLFHYYFLIYSINPIIFSTEPQMWVPQLSAFLLLISHYYNRLLLIHWLPALRSCAMKVLEILKSLSAEQHWTAKAQGISIIGNERKQWLIVALPCTNLLKLSNLHVVAADDIVLEKILQQQYIDAINRTKHCSC